jgi:hypothetical protein
MCSSYRFPEVAMEIHMHSHRWEHRSPDWTAAAVSGFLAGAVLMVLGLLWSAVTDASPWITSHRIAAIVMGPEALQLTDFSFLAVAAALVTHYVLGIVFGLVMGAVIAPFHLDSSTGMVLLVGAVFGLALYLLNFYGMVLFFPWFADMRGWATLAAHLIFGIVTAYMYRQLEWRGSVMPDTKNL